MPFVIDADETTFTREVERCDLPVLVDFWNPGCAPCQTVAPTLEDLARELNGRAKVVAINTLQNKKLAGRFGVQSFPTVILFNGGLPRQTLVGVRSKIEYLRHLEEL